jgi:peptide deformylase
VTVLDIAHLGHPLLRERAREVTREELASPRVQRFIDDLVETMRHANGAGLAATQVLEPLRIVAVEVENNPRYPYKPRIPLTVLVNPVLTPLPSERPAEGDAPGVVRDERGLETFDNYEGCLSVPNLRGVVRRFARVRVTGWDREGQKLERTYHGLSAGTFQHEVDHLDGLLFVDRVTDTKTLTTWAEFDRFHKAAFVERIVPFVAKMGG